MGDAKRILLVAATTGYQTRAFAEAGERLGYTIQLATDRCHVLSDPWGDHAIALRFEDPEKASLQLANAARKLGAFDGIVGVGDRPAHLAAMAARELNLRFSPPEAVLASRNKYLARERFRAARVGRDSVPRRADPPTADAASTEGRTPAPRALTGLNVPSYRRVSLEAGPSQAAAGARYPCVLKPLGLSASRGVIRANDSDEFIAAFERIRNILASPDIVRMHEDQDRFLQVEDYIDGQEFALEGLLTGGTLQTIALFDKPDPLTGPYFEETIYVTPSRAPVDVQDAIFHATQEGIAALGLTDGPVHAEMRVNNAGVWLLEIAARPIGGLCAQALRFDSGMGLEEVILQHAAGDAVASLRLNAPARGVMMIPIAKAGIYTGVTGVEAARNTPGIENVVITAKTGQHMTPLPDGASYLGFIFAAGETPAAVEQALRTAHGHLEFEILEALAVL